MDMDNVAVMSVHLRRTSLFGVFKVRCMTIQSISHFDNSRSVSSLWKRDFKTVHALVSWFSVTCEEKSTACRK